jgi:hypothetical protein
MKAYLPEVARRIDSSAPHSDFGRFKAVSDQLTDWWLEHRQEW